MYFIYIYLCANANSTNFPTKIAIKFSKNTYTSLQLQVNKSIVYFYCQLNLNLTDHKISYYTYIHTHIQHI